MKLSPLFVGFLIALTSIQLFGAEPKKPADKAPPTPGVELATLTTQVTGIAISPLLGVSAVGAYQYFKASTPAQKAKLPWFAHPMVWICGLLLVGAVAFKDSFGAVIPPGMKKPFDALEVAENKLSGLVASGAVVPVLVGAATRYLGSTGGSADAAHASFGGLAMLHLGAIDFSWALNILMVPLAVVVFAIVWITSHAITVLILLSPWGAVDAFLKGARTAVLGLVTATAYIDPVVGATLSVAIIVIAYFCAGWAFRLTVFGTVFTWDFFTLRRHRFTPAPTANWVFTARKLEKVPVRTYGRLIREVDGALKLAYRPWLVLPERVASIASDKLAVGRGFFWPTVEMGDTEGRYRTLLTLPPRYKGHEAQFATAYAITEIREVGLRRGWKVLKELFGGKADASAASVQVTGTT